MKIVQKLGKKQRFFRKNPTKRVDRNREKDK